MLRPCHCLDGGCCGHRPCTAGHTYLKWLGEVHCSREKVATRCSARAEAVWSVNCWLERSQGLEGMFGTPSFRWLLGQYASIASTEGLLEKFRANWLTPDGQDAFLGALSIDAAAEPLDWRKAVRRHPHTRAVSVAMETLGILAEDVDVMRIDPLLNAGFLDAVCREGGRKGFVDRTAASRHLFGAVLPDSVLSRSTKARFNRAVFGEQSRAFVEQWDGTGVDTDLVDVQRLRDEWAADAPHALTFPLLQSCWLSAHG